MNAELWNDLKEMRFLSKYAELLNDTKFEPATYAMKNDEKSTWTLEKIAKNLNKDDSAMKSYGFDKAKLKGLNKFVSKLNELRNDIMIEIQH